LGADRRASADKLIRRELVNKKFGPIAERKTGEREERGQERAAVLHPLGGLVPNVVVADDGRPMSVAEVAAARLRVNFKKRE
jgi:hypothetical protein